MAVAIAALGGATPAIACSCIVPTVEDAVREAREAPVIVTIRRDPSMQTPPRLMARHQRLPRAIRMVRDDEDGACRVGWRGDDQRSYGPITAAPLTVSLVPAAGRAWTMGLCSALPRFSGHPRVRAALAARPR